jgi:hypothetical protein
MTKAQGWLLIGAVYVVAAMVTDSDFLSLLFAFTAAVNSMYAVVLFVTVEWRDHK